MIYCYYSDDLFAEDVFVPQKTKSLGSRSDSFSRKSVDLLGVEDDNQELRSNSFNF